MTAKARLLASDLTTPALLDATVISSICFPDDDIANRQAIRETRLPRDVYVQVVDVENLSKSRWEQVEELEAVERGELTRGREVVRLPVASTNSNDDGDEQQQQQSTAIQGVGAAGSSSSSSNAKNATHRLVVQDCKGQKVYALELTRIPKIGIGTLNIGEKILLKKGTIIARGMILLEPATCQILGGKVEAWHKAWVEGRLARLKESVETAR